MAPIIASSYSQFSNHLKHQNRNTESPQTSNKAFGINNNNVNNNNSSNTTSSTTSPIMIGKAQGKKRLASDQTPSNSPPAMPPPCLKKRPSFASFVDPSMSVHRQRSMFLAYIDNAFNEKAMGDLTNYNQIISQLKPDTRSYTGSGGANSHLTSWLEVLVHVVSQLDSSHVALVDAILQLQWSVMEERFVNTYVKFICCLLSAHPEWAKRVLDRLVRGFKYRSNYKKASVFAEQDPNVTVEMSIERHHQLLQTLLDLVPTLPSTLLPAIVQGFPPKRASRKSQVVYISNVLQIIGYCTSIASDLWKEVINSAIKMDLDIQVEIDDLEDDEGELDEAVFGFDMAEPFQSKTDQVEADSDDEDGNESDNSDDDYGEDGNGNLDFENISDDEDAMSSDDDDKATSLNPTAARLKRQKTIEAIAKMAAKLDAVLKIIFDHLHKYSSASTPTSSSFPNKPFALGGLSQNELTDTLLSLFEEQLLSTFSTHHVQFLLFYYSALSSSFTDRFVGELIYYALQNQSTPLVNRVSAASYVSSFVSRAKHVGKEEARRVMDLLTGWCDDWLDSDEPRTVHRSTMFYAVANSIFYLFCFRWKDFLDEDEDDLAITDADSSMAFSMGIDDVISAPNPSGGGRKWSPCVSSIRKIVFSSMNPLRVCSKNIALQFAKVALKTDFLYCYGLLEDRKKRSHYYYFSRSPANASNLTEKERKQQGLPVEEDQVVKQMLLEARMDSHFPFDPYKLPLSRQFVQENYRDWEGFDDDDDEDDDDDTDDEGDARSSLSSSSSSSDGLPIPKRHDSQEDLGQSFDGMSISR